MHRFLGALVLAAATMASAAEHPPVAGHVTFLYFNDLDKANHFYSEVLGLETAFDLDWVNIYKLSPTSSWVSSTLRAAHTSLPVTNQ